MGCISLPAFANTDDSKTGLYVTDKMGASIVQMSGQQFVYSGYADAGDNGTKMEIAIVLAYLAVDLRWVMTFPISLISLFELNWNLWRVIKRIQPTTSAAVCVMAYIKLVILKTKSNSIR